MKENIYETIRLLMEKLASVSDLNELADLESGAVLLENGLAEFHVEGGHHRFSYERRGRHAVVPGIVLEFSPTVSFDYEDPSDDAMSFANIKGLKVTVKLGPINLASTELKQVTYKRLPQSVTAIDARIKLGFLPVPLKFSLNPDWSLAGLG